MSMKIICHALPYAIFGAALFASGQAPAAGQGAGRSAAPAPRPDNPQSLAHIDAAKKLAGDDALLRSPYNFYCVAGNARGNNATAPELEPTRIFDNLYAV